MMSLLSINEIKHFCSNTGLHIYELLLSISAHCFNTFTASDFSLASLLNVRLIIYSNPPLFTISFLASSEVHKLFKIWIPFLLISLFPCLVNLKIVIISSSLLSGGGLFEVVSLLLFNLSSLPVCKFINICLL